MNKKLIRWVLNDITLKEDTKTVDDMMKNVLNIYGWHKCIMVSQHNKRISNIQKVYRKDIDNFMLDMLDDKSQKVELISDVTKMTFEGFHFQNVGKNKLVTYTLTVEKKC